MRSAFSIFAIPGICLTMATNSFGLPTMTSYLNTAEMHAATDLETALDKVRTSCGGISAELNQMKTLAGIGTGVSAAGTVAGGVALGTGIAKAKTDKDVDVWYEAWNEIVQANNSDCQEEEGISVCPINPDTVEPILKKYGLVLESGETVESKRNELESKSETLGNIRTGTLAATTATNIAGAAVGGVNMKKARGSLAEQVSECLASVKELSAAYGQARISRTASDEDLGRVETIVRVCNEWSTVDLSKIDNRATGSFASSVVGATTGAAGTITSALANSENIRTANDQKEKNLNLASNVLAGGATVASTAATIFNATQISAIKRASTVADACEGALKN